MKWEYVTAYLGDPEGPSGHGLVNRSLAEYGDEGWELVAVVGHWGYFKQPVVSTLLETLEMHRYICEGGCHPTAVYQGKPCDCLSVEDVTEMHGCICEGDCDCWEKDDPLAGADAEEAVR